MADANLAEQIATDLSRGELDDEDSSVVLDIVTRTLEALPDFGVQLVRTYGV